MKYETDDEFRRQLANALKQFAIEARLDEAQCVFANWNVLDRDFEKWYRAHVNELQRQLEGSRKP